MLRERRVHASGLTISLVYLLILETKLLGCQADAPKDLMPTPGNSSAPVEATCTPTCGPGHECVHGRCSPLECSEVFNCSGAEREVVCGTNGVTFQSLCELEKESCEIAQAISVDHEGICVTALPPPAQICRQHQRAFESNLTLFIAKCDTEGLYNGTLNKSELYYCYKPQCNIHTESYLIKQCRTAENWCWCSTLDGHPIPGTFQRDMPPNYCSNLIDHQDCKVDDKTYKDGDIFTPSDVCGLCECLDGTANCFVNITINSDNRLPSDQLETLKKDLVLAFNFQFNHNSHEELDIREIYKHPVEVSSSQRETVLKWKFAHYDRIDDNVLQYSEEFLFHKEVFDLFGCFKVYDHIQELTNANGDSVISEDEWLAFFVPQPEMESSGSTATTELEEHQLQPVTQSDTVVKREAPLTHLGSKQPDRRRKTFRYILY